MNIVIIAFIVLMRGFSPISYVDALPAYNSINNERSTAPKIELLELSSPLVLSSGATWNVTCKSNKPIIWKPYDAWFDWIPPNVCSNVIRTEDEDMQYGAILSIKNASAASVGHYYCVPFEKKDEHLDELVTEEIAASIYVSVKDSEQPLVPTPGLTHYFQNPEGFIPCKPSHPDEEVELCNKYDLLQCLPTPDDPKKGFRISKASFIVPEDGRLICKNYADNASYEIVLVPTKKELPDIKQDDHELQIDRVEKQFDTLSCITIISIIAFAAFIIFGFIYYRDKLTRIGEATRTLILPSNKYEQAPI